MGSSDALMGQLTFDIANYYTAAHDSIGLRYWVNKYSPTDIVSLLLHAYSELGHGSVLPLPIASCGDEMRMIRNC